ncbi:MAG: DUF2752 domain-containing protein [Owenweeksia sp.]|nr:DUF2752 domain-containing protein [Owenweeksia sp.]
MLHFAGKYFELAFWTCALLALYFMPVTEEHFTLCPLGAIGLESCPGCGIGHSIHYLLHFEWAHSWQEHYLGGFALIVILYRIFQLVKINTNHKQLLHGAKNI